MTDLDLDGEWYGWRLRGRYLVSDDGQRMTVERLRGLMWRDKMVSVDPPERIVGRTASPVTLRHRRA